MRTEFKLMMKCDMCYDRTSVGKKPMCASVCPSGALFFGTTAEIAALRPQSKPINQFLFGRQEITTKVFIMVPRNGSLQLDVTAQLDRPALPPDRLLENLWEEDDSNES